MKMLKAVLFIFTLFFVFQEAAPAKSKKNQHYRVPEVTSKIKPDGVLEEEVWQKALVLELKYEVEPGENIEPPVKTEVLLAYSRTNLYVAFRAYDPEPANIRARVSDRDNIGGQDWVGVILDTFNDERRSFDFLCNPYGVQDDFIETAVGGGGQWDTIWTPADESPAKVTSWRCPFLLAPCGSSARTATRFGDSMPCAVTPAAWYTTSGSSPATGITTATCASP